MPTDKKISELPNAVSVNSSDVSVLVNGDTDYQYTFTLLLQFLQANLVTGANISFGITLPQNTSGKNGDVFVNTAVGSFAQKVSGTWSVVYTPPAAGAADGTLLYGTGLPAAATGKNLDSYINTLTGIFYKKSADAWSQVFSMATGPQGPQGATGTNGTNGADGNTILFGTINPSNSTTGVNGNFYINTSNYTLFGPKTAGAWGSGASLLGAGLPNGGSAGQILVKADATDYNTVWEDNSFANLTGNPADNANLSTALSAKQDSLGYTPENIAAKNQANGYPGLDGSGKVAASQLPSYVDDVLEFANYAALPAPGEAGKIYVTLDTNSEYRWSGSTYIQLVGSPGTTDAVVEGSVNKYFTAARVLATVLTGIGFSSATAVLATDTILQALGKLQAQIKAIPSGGGGSDYTNLVFNQVLTFDRNFKMVTTQTSDIAFSLGSGPVENVLGQISITGDGVHAVNFPADWTNAAGNVYDNQQQNIIDLEYCFGLVRYAITKIIIPDVIPPYLLSATIENTDKNKIVLQYSELLDEGSVPATGAFSVNLSKAVIAVTVLGSQVTITVDSNYINSDVATISYTLGGNPVKDIAGNNAVSLSNQAITNNVNPARQSVSITAFNQVLKNTVFPTNFDYSSTGGGVQKPISVSFWIKRNNTNSRYIFSMDSNKDAPQFQLTLNSDGTPFFSMYGSGGYGGSGYCQKSVTAAIPANTWTMITLTTDGTGTAAGVKVYYGTSLQSMTINRNDYNVITSNDAAMRLAVLGNNSTTAGNELVNVQLASFYVWMYELTSGDVSALYNSGQLIDPTSLSFASGLKGQYEFNGNAFDSASGVTPVYTTDAP